MMRRILRQSSAAQVDETGDATTQAESDAVDELSASVCLPDG